MQASQVHTTSGREECEPLTFTLGRKEYDIDIIKVQDIRGYDAVTSIANAPEFIKFAERMVSMVKDGVSDVTPLKPGKIKPAPEFDSSLDTKYLLGLGTLDDLMIILVDIERLMTSSDMELIEAVEKSTA